MKKNKGFMLTEVIFVSVVVLTAMLTLYKSYSKLYKVYTERNNYNNVDGIYAIKSVTDSMIQTGAINTALSSLNNNNKIKYILEKDYNCDTGNPNSNTICEKVKAFYGITYMIIVNKKDIGSITFSKNESLTNYIKYVKKKAYDSNKNFNYIIIVEYKENNKFYYSNLKLR